MTEAEKRLHRCCITGHTPEVLNEKESVIRERLEQEIRKAITDGFVTFISGLKSGPEIWAAEAVIRLRDAEFPDIHLIAALPYKGFEFQSDEEGIRQFNYCFDKADYVKYISDGNSRYSRKQKNKWMLDHSSRLIAVYNETPGETRNAITYARKMRIKTDIIELPSVKAKFQVLHQPGLIVNAPKLRIEEKDFLAWENETELESEYPF